MFEETVADIYSRLEIIFNSNIYKRNLSDPKNNWLDIPVNVVIESVLKCLAIYTKFYEEKFGIN